MIKVNLISCDCQDRVCIGKIYEVNNMESMRCAKCGRKIKVNNPYTETFNMDGKTSTRELFVPYIIRAKKIKC